MMQQAMCEVAISVNELETSSRRDEMSLVTQVTLQPFDKWEVDFVGLINSLGKRTGVRYIITVTDCLTRWVKAAPIVDCTAAIAPIFLFEKIVTRFGCPRILMRNKGSHFINCTVSMLMEELHIQDKKSTLYHPQEN